MFVKVLSKHFVYKIMLFTLIDILGTTTTLIEKSVIQSVV